ncbi:MAG: aminotransferase class III-fold pyridoxal phosphate-dependent enzyme [Candidatus Yanofskybacteria bacterium]|nr:aminotransferase class III-fold pyridoxal phosphate-dependent enzyme [Candidatus Yanofskybacteria bacterium]
MENQNVIKNFRHVGLVVRNIKKSLDFYQNFLGLTIARQDTETGDFISHLAGIDNVTIEWIKLNIPGGGLLELIQHHSHPDPRTNQKPDLSLTNQLGCSHPAFTVSDLQALHDHLTRNGYQCLSEPLHSPDGKVKVLFAYDPDGILLELVEEKAQRGGSKVRIKTKHRIIKDGFVLEKGDLYYQLYEMEPHSAAQAIPITWSKAKDFSVYDDQGNKWIDMTSGIFVANAGHANPAIKAAIQKQLDDDLLFAYNYPTTIRRDLVSRLLSLSSPHFTKVALLNSGSEAVDLAYKLIKNWGNRTNRRHIISLRGSYHGRGLSNDLICGNKNKADWSGVSDPGIHFIDFPYKESDEFNPDHLPPAKDITAFFLETFQGWGAWFYPPKFITKLYDFAKQNGILICFDEMQSGFYRIGPLYGYMTYGEIEPDILCLGKGMASSLPLSAVLSRDEIIDYDKKADLHGTHSGNPLCSAAGLASLNFLSDPKQIEKRTEVMNVFQSELSKLSEFSSIKQVNARGMIAGLIFNESDTATKVALGCINRGVLVVCTFRESIKLAPPLTITADAVYEAVGVIRDCIANTEKA